MPPSHPYNQIRWLFGGKSSVGRSAIMSGWRNWQTRTFEGRVGFPVRVQVPSSTPNRDKGPWYFTRVLFHIVRSTHDV
jgi:hypothetical protein